MAKKQDASKEVRQKEASSLSLLFGVDAAGLVSSPATPAATWESERNVAERRERLRFIKLRRLAADFAIWWDSLEEPPRHGASDGTRVRYMESGKVTCLWKWGL